MTIYNNLFQKFQEISNRANNETQKIFGKISNCFQSISLTTYIRSSLALAARSISALRTSFNTSLAKLSSITTLVANKTLSKQNPTFSVVEPTPVITKQETTPPVVEPTPMASTQKPVQNDKTPVITKQEATPPVVEPTPMASIQKPVQNDKTPVITKKETTPPVVEPTPMASTQKPVQNDKTPVITKQETTPPVVEPTPMASIQKSIQIEKPLTHIEQSPLAQNTHTVFSTFSGIPQPRVYYASSQGPAWQILQNHPLRLRKQTTPPLLDKSLKTSHLPSSIEKTENQLKKDCTVMAAALLTSASLAYTQKPSYSAPKQKENKKEEGSSTVKTTTPLSPTQHLFSPLSPSSVSLLKPEETKQTSLTPTLTNASVEKKSLQDRKVIIEFMRKIAEKGISTEQKQDKIKNLKKLPPSPLRNKLLNILNSHRSLNKITERVTMLLLEEFSLDVMKKMNLQLKPSKDLELLNDPNGSLRKSFPALCKKGFSTASLEAKIRKTFLRFP